MSQNQIHKVGATCTTKPRTINAVWVDDDNFFFKWLLPEMFKVSGDTLKIQEFDSPLPALDRIKSNRPDIVLTHLLMSPPDGIQLIKLIRKFDTQVPIIVVSSRCHPKILNDATNAGATSFFYKLALMEKSEIRRLHEEIEKFTQHAAR